MFEHVCRVENCWTRWDPIASSAVVWGRVYVLLLDYAECPLLSRVSLLWSCLGLFSVSAPHNGVAQRSIKTDQSSPQQGDLRLSGPPSGHGADGGARTRERRIPTDLRADSLATMPPTFPPQILRNNIKLSWH
ncbi:hypothetical protein PoB_007313200 [Plakobranchus ocellatus]|uniref:Uncharacterized protein n=1 Tax=Plakobranchus ocellatus TaxID=259542 RepID=A0AAV4DRA3_9GAST|nr:hypothetical protein PoB_007313200 [Plakobranchus ocellatus]